MFQRLANSWELVKASWSVLRADKELVLFPLASTIATILVMIAFTIPTLLAGVFDHLANNGGPGIAGYVIAFFFYLTMYFVTIFANTALVGAAMIRLQGGDPTLNDGIQIAMDRVGNILGYAMIAATFGLVMRYLREKGGALGQFVAWLGDMAWGLATYLVVPILVVENIGPIDAIQRSAGLLKKTWGEQIAGNFSIGIVFGLLTFAAILVVGVPLIVLAIASGSVAFIILAIAITVIVVMGISLVGTTLNGIYVAAVYRYATEGVVDAQYFSPQLIEGAFKEKRKRH